jgi:nucleoside-diphosphate-sugar epimerase
MTKILVTGANSFIGTNFLKYSENRQNREISLFDVNPEEIDFNEVDVVLHLAAIVHHFDRISVQEYFHINKDLAIRVAEQSKNSSVKHFIFLSTVKVFGKFLPGSDPWKEDFHCFPDDNYGKSKYEAEIALRNLENTDFTVSIIRTPIVYGPGVKANMLKLIHLIEKFSVLPFANVINNRHYTYIENLIGYIDRIIKIRASGTFIAMDDSGLSTSDLVKYLAEFLNRKIVLLKVPDILLSFARLLKINAADQLYGSFYLDNTKTKKILNFTPPYTIEEGLRKMITSYLENKESDKLVK